MQWEWRDTYVSGSVPLSLTFAKRFLVGGTVYA